MACSSSSLHQSASLTFSCDLECVCSICQDLLTEDPEAETSSIGGPSLAKRSRPNDDNDSSPSSSGSSSFSRSWSTSSSGSESTTELQQNPTTPELCTTPCGHIFHKSCLLNWTERKSECPTCRKKLLPQLNQSKKVQKLTRVFLPLTPGQCRQCKERIRQMETYQLNYVIEQSRADAEQKKTEEWHERCIAIAQQNEDLEEKLHLDEEKLEELEAQLEAEKVDKKILERRMSLEKQTFQAKIDELQTDLDWKEQEILNYEKLERTLNKKCEKLEKDKKKLAKKLKVEMKKSLLTSFQQDWKKMYAVAVLERDKYKADRDYEKGRANLFEGWYNQVRSSYEDGDHHHYPLGHHRSLVGMNTVNNSSSLIYMEPKVTIQQTDANLQLSESEEEEKADDEGCLSRSMTITLDDSDNEDQGTGFLSLSSSSSSSTSSESSESDSSSSSSDDDDEEEEEEVAGGRNENRGIDSESDD